MKLSKPAITILLLCLAAITHPSFAAVNVWTKNVKSPPLAADQGAQVAVDSSGNCYVAGTVSDRNASHPSATDMAIAKYDPSGNLIWSRKSSNQGGNNDIADCIAIDPNGNVIIGGRRSGIVCMLKYSPDGALLQNDTLVPGTIYKCGDADPNGTTENQTLAIPFGYIDAITFDTSGNAVAVGLSIGPTIYKFDASGKLVWYDFYSNGSVPGVIVDQAQNVYLVYNHVYGVNNWVTGITKFSPSGATVWIRKLATNAVITSVTSDTAGNSYIAGSTPGTTSISVGFAFKCNTSGQIVWSKQVIDKAGGNVVATSICHDAVGNIYAAYYYSSSGIALVNKYSADGIAAWSSKLSVPKAPTGISVDSTGNVFVAAGSVGQLDSDTGAVVASYDDSYETAYSAVAADGNGNCYLTGSQFAVSKWSGANGDVTAISGFGYNGAGFTENDSSSITPMPFFSPIQANTLYITSTEPFEACSIFSNTPQTYNRFQAGFTFRYVATTNIPGDGLTFTIQNDPRGLNALGGEGVCLGYVGGTNPAIADSFALKLAYDGVSRGTALAIDGASGGYTPPGKIDLLSGHPIYVDVTYNGTTVTEILTDTVTKATFTGSRVLDLKSIVGGSDAFVGFTGGDATANALVGISNFSYQGFSAQ